MAQAEGDSKIRWVPGLTWNNVMWDGLSLAAFYWELRGVFLRCARCGEQAGRLRKERDSLLSSRFDFFVRCTRCKRTYRVTMERAVQDVLRASPEAAQVAFPQR